MNITLTVRRMVNQTVLNMTDFSVVT